VIGNVFEISDSPCKKQYVGIIYGYFFLAKVVNPLIEPTIERAPSVQISTHWFHVMLNLSIYDKIKSTPFCPRVHSIIYLQQKIQCFVFIGEKNKS